MIRTPTHRFRLRSPRHPLPALIQAVAGSPRRIAAITTLSLTLLSLVLGAYSPHAVAAQGTSSSGTPASVMCPVDSSNVPTAAKTAGQVYSIADSSSTASYSVDEVLNGRGDNTAVGTTQAVIGTILLDKSGTPLPCSTFYVDLRTLKTDDDRRDGQVQKVLQTTDYPLGTFVLTSVDGLSGSLTDGQEHTLKLTGDLTVHNVTRTVTWDAKVKVDGKTLTGTASTSITFADFGMDAPVFGPVASIKDQFQLSVDLTATSAS